MAKLLPSVEFLNECFDYDKETDSLTWKEKRPADHFENARLFREFNTKYSGKLITYNRVTIDSIAHSTSRVKFKIKHGYCNSIRVNQKGGVTFKKGNGHQNKPYCGRITFDSKRFCEFFKTEKEALDWLDEMRLKFEKNEIPIIKHNKTPESGRFGVHKYRDLFRATITHGDRLCVLGIFNTVEEASEAYQLAKQQIQDGCFIPPDRRISNTGLKGVFNRGDKFEANYKNKYIGTFNTLEEAHEAYLKAKNHKTFDDGLDILQKLADEYNQ